MVLCPEKAGCFECPFTTKPLNQGMVPLSFELLEADGLSASYRQGKKYKPAPIASVIFLHSGQKVIGLRVHAPRNASLGSRKLQGKITYSSGVDPPITETTTFEIPLKIVPGNAKTTQNDWPYASHVGQHVVTVLTAPLTGIQYLILLIACHGGGCGL